MAITNYPMTGLWIEIAAVPGTFALQVIGSQAEIAVSAAAPATNVVSFYLSPGVVQTFTTSDNLWARGASGTKVRITEDILGAAGGGGAGALTAEYNTTPPVLTNGEETPLQTNVSGDLKVQIQNTGTAVPIFSAFEFELVAASQTAQVIGATGAAGDYLSHVIVSPATAACGVVTILDNATSVVAFPGGGTTALSNLIPFVIPIGMKSVSGAWKITTGANVSCAAVGDFT